MYITEQKALVYIIEQLPKMNISFEQIESDLVFVTAKTLYNYVAGRTKPKGKKYSFLTYALHKRYPYEYNCAKAKFERENGKTIDELIAEEVMSYSTL